MTKAFFEPGLSYADESAAVSRRHRLGLLVVVVAFVGVLLVLDRLAAGYASTLIPGAPPAPLLGNWLSAARVDHVVPGATSLMLATGAMFFAILVAFTQMFEAPGKFLALPAFACTTAGLLANGLSLLLQRGTVMDFLTVRIPSDLTQTLFSATPGQVLDGRSSQTLHFVPADLALWFGAAVAILWLTYLILAGAGNFLARGLRLTRSRQSGSRKGDLLS